MKERYPSPEPFASHQTPAAPQEEIKAWAAGEAGVGWRAELWREKVRQYNRRYRERNPERKRANQVIYQARWKAKVLGIPQPPLPAKRERKGVQCELSLAEGERSEKC